MENRETFVDSLSSTGQGLIDSIVEFVQGIFGAVEGLLSSGEETATHAGSSTE